MSHQNKNYPFVASVATNKTNLNSGVNIIDTATSLSLDFNIKMKNTDPSTFYLLSNL